MRSRIFTKLFLTLLLSFSGTVLVLYLVVNSSFQKGFKDYLFQKEIHQTEEMSGYLISHYREHDGWAEFKHNEPLWREALFSAKIPVRPKRPGPPPPHRSGPKDRPPPPHHSPIHRSPKPEGHQPPEGKSLAPLAMRISLYDANKQLVFGKPNTAGSGNWISISDNAVIIGWLYLIPSELSNDELAKSFIEQQQKNFILIATIVVLLSTLIASAWARYVLKPINRVIKASEQISSGKYNVRVPIKGNDELARLALHFNDMAEALQHNENLRRQWQADISHELRTPLAIIRGEVEALLDGLRQSTPERLASIYEEIEALGLIIDDLYQLSLADSEALHMQFVSCNLLPVINHQIELFKPIMAEKSIALSLPEELECDSKVNADPHRIAQVVSNLLENSLRYTAAGGEVAITLHCTEQQFTFMISDSTPGVNDQEIEQIFDRLYCVDKSRSRSLSGSGLGLSICRSIVAAHGGKIYAQHSHMGGLSIIVELPTSPV